MKPAGALIPNYCSTGHVSLHNYISMIGGQSPNEDTSADCQIYQDFTATTTTTDGQALGAGCVFPTTVPNIGAQLTAAGVSWKDSHVAADLSSLATTAQFNFYTPNPCDDGHDSPCVTGQPGALADRDAFNKMFVPIVTNSPAFEQDGLLIIITDEAATSDATSCCGEMETPVDETPGYRIRASDRPRAVRKRYLYVFGGTLGRRSARDRARVPIRSSLG